MTGGDGWLLLSIALCLLIAAVVVSAETAIARLSAAQVQELRREGDRRA